MRYKEGIIPKTPGQLNDLIGNIMLRAPRRQFPDFEDFDGAFYSAQCGVENLRQRFGDPKADQLLDMLAAAKAHYQATENKLAGALMEDTSMTLRNRQPWAYPKELYRWRVDASHPEISEADYRDKMAEN